jgi:hypothetical protein
MLFEAKATQTHRGLLNLLKGKQVLALGYSGRGDIDIAPHLRQSQAEYYWVVRGNEAPFLGQAIEWNLGPNDNPLTQLAELTRTDFPATHEKPTEIITHWLSETAYQLEEFLTLLFEWRSQRALAHLRSAQLSALEIDEAVDLYAQVGRYLSALFAAYMWKSKWRQREAMIDYCAFSLWRLGAFGRARQVLTGRVTQILNNREAGPLSERDANTLRTYVEICLDLLQLMPNEQCKARAQTWHLPQVGEALSRATLTNPKDDLLRAIEVLHLRWLLGDTVSFESVEELLNVARERDYSNIAYVGVRALLQFSLERAIPHYGLLQDDFKRIGRGHYIPKNNESLRIGRWRATSGERRWLKHWVWRTQASHIYFARTVFVELLWWARGIKWARWRRLWRCHGVVRIEAGRSR